MGNFSNDPAARAADAVSKQHVAVRIQQAVPLLDADLNLLDDIRRMEHENINRLFVGSGVPAGDDGFSIGENTSNANNFSIRGGVCLVAGKLVRNDADTTYTTQPGFNNPKFPPLITALTTPASPRNFIVYLDVFEREVDSQEDPSLVDARIGVETAIRMRREWAVRVAREPEDLPTLDSPPPGHVFLRLARLRRNPVPGISATMIEDLRDTQLSILRKIEVRDSMGLVVVDNARFQQMVENTSNNALKLIQYLTTQFNSMFAPLSSAEILGLNAIQHVAQTAQAGLSNLNALTLANRGALAYMRQLYAAEQNLMKVWRDVMLLVPAGSAKKYASYTSFVNGLDDRLNDPTVGSFTGLKAALDASNLFAAVEVQEEISRLIGASGAPITRGAIQVSYTNAPPGNLLVGQTARIEFRVRSFTTLVDTYLVKVLPAPGWPRALVDSTGVPIPGNRVSIPAAGGQVTLFVDVLVQAAGSTGLQLEVTSDSNPAEIDQSSGLITLTVGQPAPLGEDKVQFSVENPFNASINNGIVQMTRGTAGSVRVRVSNNTGQAATFALAATVQPGAVGTWTVNATPTTVAIPNTGDSTVPSIDITPGATASSCLISFTATATIAGSTLKVERIIPCSAS